MSEGPGINSSEVERDLKTLADLIREGKLGSVDPEVLTRLLNALCIARTGASTNALHIVQGLVVNHEQMVRHLTKLDVANGKTQKWFMVLAVASLIASGVSIVQSLIPKSVEVPTLQDARPAVQSDTQKHDATSKVDPSKSAPPIPKK